jgi:hypothetical protein
LKDLDTKDADKDLLLYHTFHGEAYYSTLMDKPDYEGPFNCIVTDYGIYYTGLTDDASSELGLSIGDMIVLPIDTKRVHASAIALVTGVIKKGESVANTNNEIWNSINVYAGQSLQIVKIEKQLIFREGNPYARSGFPCIHITSLKYAVWFKDDVIESINSIHATSQETVFVTRQEKFDKQKVIVIKSPIKDKRAVLSALNFQENSLIEGTEFVVLTGDSLIANYSIAMYKPVR